MTTQTGLLHALLSILFHLSVVTVLIRSYQPIIYDVPPPVLKSLLSGSNRGYVIPASELEIFKPFLPKNGSLSLITNFPFGNNVDEEKFFHDARNFLAPLILNSKPEELGAIVYCTNSEIADQRLSQTGYQWALRISDGKGIAFKKT